MTEFAAGNVFSTLVNEGLRLSLAGAQDKLPVILIANDRLALPEGTTPSSHILKFANRDYRGIVDNEYLMLSLARAVGLTVPRAMLWRLPSGNHALLIERFDREHGTKHGRLHQEDFCQATGRPSSAKYEVDGGPSFASMIDVLTQASTEPLDPLTLIQIQAFHIATGNNDGHAKNFSLLREPTVRLAPAYDLVCTRAWSHLDKHLGISVGGLRDAGAIGPRAWAALAETAGLSAKSVANTALDIAERVHGALLDVSERVIAEGANVRAVRHAAKLIAQHARRALQLHQQEPLRPRR